MDTPVRKGMASTYPYRTIVLATGDATTMGGGPTKPGSLPVASATQGMFMHSNLSRRSWGLTHVI